MGHGGLVRQPAIHKKESEIEGIIRRLRLMYAREKKILIWGGGFGGMRAALDLAAKKLPDTKITLISDKSHFECHPALKTVV